jgi:MFS family permease
LTVLGHNPAQDHYPPSARAWWLVAILFVGGLISYMHRLALGVIVAPLGSDLGLTDPQISLLQGAAFALIYVLAGLPLGRLADRGYRRNLILGGSALWSLGTLLCALAPDFWTLFGARCVVGIGEATLAPAAASMIADSFPPHRRGIALGIFLTGTVLGGPAAIGIGGPLLSAAEGGAFAALPLLGGLAPWRIVLVIFALVSFALPLALLTVREPARLREGVAESRTDLGWALSAWRLLLPLLLGVALLSIGDYGLFSWAPAAINREHGWSHVDIGVAFGLITSIAGVIGAFGGGVLSDLVARRWGDASRLGVTAVAALAGAAGAALFAAGSAHLALVGVCIWSLASAIGAVSGIAALQALVPPSLRGTGMSLVAFCNTLLGLGLGPTAVAMASDAIGTPSGTSLAIASVISIAALLSAVLSRLAVVAGRQAA